MSQRVNISVPDELYALMKENPELNYSRICQKAIEAAILARWAQGEQDRLLALLEE